MTHSDTTMSLPRSGLSLLDKTVAVASWALAGAIFLEIGWLAMAPDDPRGAVSLLSRPSAVSMLLQAGALAAVCASIAAVMAGRRLPDAGVFAAAVGLTLVSLEGGTTTALLIARAQEAGAPHRALSLALAGESVGWFAVLFVAAWVSAAVTVWCHAPRGPRGSVRWLSPWEDTMPLLAVDLRLPGVHRSAFSGLPLTPVNEGLRHALVTAGGTLAAVALLSTGLGHRTVEHGQACFIVAAGVLLAGRLAHRVAPVRSPGWSLIGVGFAAAAGYLWAAVQSAGVAPLASVPPSRFLRILPIQFLAVGTAVAMATFWSIRPASRGERP